MPRLMPGLIRPCLLVLVAGFAFALVSSAIRSVVPWPEGFQIREKLEAYQDVKDECDVLYFGSSYVFRSFQPLVIDRELAERGLEITSFNFGIGGMDAFETDYLMREVLSMKPARLRWVVIEPRPFFGRIAGSPNAFTERSLRWHTAEATWEALRSIWLSHDPASLKFDDVAVHLRLFARRLGNFGLGRTLVSAWMGLDEPSEFVEIFRKDRGYLPLDGRVVSAFKKRRRDFLRKPESYWEQVATMQARNTATVDLTSANVEAFRSQADAVRAAGVVPLAVMPPGLLASPVALSLWQAGVIQDLYLFNNPNKNPELFEVDMRFDRNHLNRRGAVLFSELFAEAVAERLAEGG